MAPEARYLLDSNIGIKLLKAEARATAERLSRQSRGTIVTSAVCLGEMIVNIIEAERPLLKRFLEIVPVLPFDQAAAEIYGILPFKRRSYDRLIAAHALSLGLTVVTANIADFTDVAGLRVENWER